MNQQQIDTLLDAWYAVYGDKPRGMEDIPTKRIDMMMRDYVDRALRHHDTNALYQHQLMHVHPPFKVTFVYGRNVLSVRVQMMEH